MRYVDPRRTSFIGKEIIERLSENTAAAAKRKSGIASLDLCVDFLFSSSFLKHQMPEKSGMIRSVTIRPLSGPIGNRYSSPIRGKKRIALSAHLGLIIMPAVTATIVNRRNMFSMKNRLQEMLLWILYSQWANLQM